MKKLLNITIIALFSVCLTLPSCAKKEDAPAENDKKPDVVKTPAVEPDKVIADAEKVVAGAVEVAAAEAKKAAGDLVPLAIKLPKPLFVGTPEDIKIERLEPARKGKRKPFPAPAGTVNVAADKEVTGTDDFPIIGELEMITDGDKDGADGSYVELAPNKQDVVINLGGEYNIYAVVIWHYHKQGRVYKDVVVQVSTDQDFIDVATVFNNDHDNSAALGVGEALHYVESYEGKLIDCKGVKGSFVKLTSNGNTTNEMNHYIEVEVYGKPVK